MVTFSRITKASAVLLLLGGCGAPPAPPAAAPVPPAPPAAVAKTNPPQEKPVPANELGVVPVLMYHRITAHPKSLYDRSPEDFRAEMETLATRGYHPITTADLVARKLDLPAGAHPVVLTFDDGDPTAFALTPEGNPVTGTGVEILLRVAAAHPGFTPVASLYVNEHPFGDGETGRALTWLRDHGFEIGNHTRKHTNLRTASAAAARQAVTEGGELIRQAIPGYQPTTLALPYGARPRSSETLHDYAGVLLVGANPAPSPYSRDFDPTAIPRIRSQSATGTDARYGSTSWLDQLESAPETRYTSDGDPAKVTHPAGAGTVAPEFAAASSAY